MLDPLVEAFDAPPFAAGQHVYERGCPENGSLRVDEVEFAFGHWRVTASAEIAPGLSRISVSAPADDFVLCPPGWREPPRCPAENPGYDAGSEVRRTELRDDAIYQVRVRKWRESLARWKRAVFGSGHA